MVDKIVAIISPRTPTLSPNNIFEFKFVFPQVLERGPYIIQLPVLNIIHCMLHYVDLSSTTSQPFNADLLRVIAKYIEVVILKA